MLPAIHGALRNLLHGEGQLSPLEVDVSFDAPTGQWIDRLTRPTVNLFLYSIQENVELRRNGQFATRQGDHGIRQLPPRRIDLRYMVSALAGDVDDTHQLLWRALSTLLKHQELPTEVLSEPLRHLDPPISARAAQPDDSKRLEDLWSALNAEPRPSFGYVLVAPLDLNVTFTTPLVFTRTLRVEQLRNGQAAGGTEMHRQIGGALRDKQGGPVAGASLRVAGHATHAISDGDGRFVLTGAPVGSVQLHIVLPSGVSQTVTLTVPSPSYEITLA